MNKPQAYVAYVPADKQMFVVEEVAKLLALARWPTVQGRRVSYPLRFDAAHPRGAALTDDDNATLEEIWKRARRTLPSFPMPESEWENYMQAFMRSSEKPDWALGCCVDDDALTHAMLRAAAEEQFTSGLISAISTGSIAARDPLTYMPCTDVRMLVGQRDLLLSRADVERFATSAMIAVQTEQDGEAGETLPNWEQRALYHHERKQRGSRSPTKDTATKFKVSEALVRADVRRLKKQEGADSDHRLGAKAGRKNGRK